MFIDITIKSTQLPIPTASTGDQTRPCTLTKLRYKNWLITILKCKKSCGVLTPKRDGATCLLGNEPVLDTEQPTIVTIIEEIINRTIRKTELKVHKKKTILS